MRWMLWDSVFPGFTVNILPLLNLLLALCRLLHHRHARPSAWNINEKRNYDCVTLLQGFFCWQQAITKRSKQSEQWYSLGSSLQVQTSFRQPIFSVSGLPNREGQLAANVMSKQCLHSINSSSKGTKLTQKIKNWASFWFSKNEIKSKIIELEVSIRSWKRTVTFFARNEDISIPSSNYWIGIELIWELLIGTGTHLRALTASVRSVIDWTFT